MASCRPKNNKNTDTERLPFSRQPFLMRNSTILLSYECRNDLTTCNYQALTFPCRYGKILAGNCQRGQKSWLIDALENGKTAKMARHGKKEYQRAYQQDYKDKVSTINIRIRKDSGILEALDEACLTNNVFRVEYLRLAVAERLEAEGYDPGYEKTPCQKSF